MKLLITGCPRSGTRYMRRVMFTLGMQLGHETWARDGAVCSMLAVDDWFYPNQYVFRGQRRSTLKPDLVWHLVRDPRAVVASISGFDGPGVNPAWWHWQERHTGIAPESPWNELTEEDKLSLASRFYIAWNERVENDPEVSWRFRVEDVPLDDIIARTGSYETSSTVTIPPYIGKSRNGKILSWVDFGRFEDPIRKIAIRYGYSE